MYEEVSRVPLIISGPDIPAGVHVDTTVSHVDTFPFILNCVGETEPGLTAGYPGISLETIAAGEKPDRTVMVEYHGMGSTTAAFMIRNGRYKYVYYVGYRPQLFDLDTDPEELNDVAGEKQYADVLSECHQKLLAICDPEEVDRKAKSRQAQLLAMNGGREAVIARGDLGFSPAPGAPKSFD